ncbi:hypothetical protein GCM10010449_39950 [Streptomyces rectiviolaceus]|uniref:Uncharacterized protein n=1 Tax=Streptomyces rectiviolaceus TaxID=332591 RepID=A0ABP6MHD1_9ACTN
MVAARVSECCSSWQVVCSVPLRGKAALLVGRALRAVGEARRGRLADVPGWVTFEDGIPADGRGIRVERWDRVGQTAAYGAALAMSPYLLIKVSWVLGSLMGLLPVGEGLDMAE